MPRPVLSCLSIAAASPSSSTSFIDLLSPSSSSMELPVMASSETSSCNDEQSSSMLRTVELIIRRQSSSLLIIDCRSIDDYRRSHLIGSIHVSLPSLLLARLRKGTLSLAAVLPITVDDLELINTVIIVADALSSIAELLRRCFVNRCCSVYMLQDGFNHVESAMNDLCEQESCGQALNLDVLSLHDDNNIVNNPTVDVVGCDFPVRILPYLYLGNAHNAADRSTLDNYDIHYILNVTHNLPNIYESTDRFKYLRIDAEDCCQDLSEHFDDAIAFIDEARSKSRGVLVHCLAGISRSVTVTLAYLMYNEQLSLEDAYDLVRNHKSNIAPNFHFMEQLVEYERRLQSPPTRRRQPRSSTSSVD